MPPDLARNDVSPTSSVVLRVGERAHQLLELHLGGRRAQPPDAQADVVALRLARRLEVPAVVELGGRQVGQLAVLELADEAGDAANLVVGEQARDVERRRGRRRGRRRRPRARARLPPLELQRRGLQLPRRPVSDLRAAAQEHDVLGVAKRGLPALQAHAAAALAEITARRAAGEQAVVAPGDVAAVIDDEREAADARRGAAGEIVEPGHLKRPSAPVSTTHLARARRRVQADAALERPRRGDRRARDRRGRNRRPRRCRRRAPAGPRAAPSRAAPGTAPPRPWARRPASHADQRDVAKRARLPRWVV